MRNTSFSLAALFLAGGQLASAALLTQTLGDVSFADNTTQNAAAFTTADGAAAPIDVAPFNGALCGVETLANSQCSTSWTFNNYGGAFANSIIFATLQIGIGDLDSNATGNQVGNLNIGGTDYTPTINAAAETNASANNNYRIYTINLLPATFAALQSGSVTVLFASAGAGLGALGATPSNAVLFDFSTLTISTQDIVPTPEPMSVSLIVSGLAGLGFLRRRLARS